MNRKYDMTVKERQEYKLLCSRELNRQRRKKTYKTGVKGLWKYIVYVDLRKMPVYTKVNAVIEEILIIEEKKCIVCKSVLSMTEKLYGDYCITHSHGQTQNINNIGYLPKIF